ncbi:MAG: response regulator [Polyangiales bacterium]
MEPHLLIADDDSGVVRTLQRFFSKRRFNSVAIASSVHEGRALIEGKTPWRGALFDVRFPDGNGFTLLEAFRRRWATAPTLMLTGVHDPSAINRATALNAAFALKPVPNEVLHAFAARLTMSDGANDGTDTSNVQRTARQFANEHGLTQAESLALETSALGASRADLPDRLGLTDNTIKTQVRGIVRKCGGEHLTDVVGVVLRRAASSR